MDASLREQCLTELATRFSTTRESPQLSIAECPSLATATTKAFGLSSLTEQDLNDFVYLAAEFAESAFPDARRRALARAGLAFLYCTLIPNDHDMYLIKQGNPQMKSVSKNTKKARDTWAFMEYKRALNFDRNDSYSSKSGQTHRELFQTSLVSAIEHSLEKWAEFCSYAQQSRSRDSVYKYSVANEELNHHSPDSLDRDEFVTETIPDGSIFYVGAEFTKTWVIKNIGNVTWRGRFLRRITPLSPTYPHSAFQIPVPLTRPGQTAALEVPVRAGYAPGFSEVRFKMVHENGDICWPETNPNGLVLAIETREHGISYGARTIPEPGQGA